MTVTFRDIWEGEVQGTSSPRTPQAGQETGLLWTLSSGVLVLTLRCFPRKAKVPPVVAATKLSASAQRAW